MAQAPRTGLVGTERGLIRQPQGPLRMLSWKLYVRTWPSSVGFPMVLTPYGLCGHTGALGLE